MKRYLSNLLLALRGISVTAPEPVPLPPAPAPLPNHKLRWKQSPIGVAIDHGCQFLTPTANIAFLSFFIMERVNPELFREHCRQEKLLQDRYPGYKDLKGE